MKLFFAFAALAAASTTTQPTTVDAVQSTEANSTVVESTAADDDSDDVFEEDPEEEEMDCSDFRAWIAETQTSGLENWEGYDEAMAEYDSEDAFWTAAQAECTAVCVEEGQSDCSDLFAATEDPVAAAAAEACTAAQETYAASANDVEKLANLAACDLACADIEGETCGSLFNSLSVALFAILAIFKY